MWVDEERIGVTCRRRETNRARLTMGVSIPVPLVLTAAGQRYV
jgi:hypothetical protein